MPSTKHAVALPQNRVAILMPELREVVASGLRLAIEEPTFYDYSP